MKRRYLFASFTAAVAALATAGWLYAQEERPREPRSLGSPGGPEAREGERGQRRGGEFRPPMMGMPAQMTANENYVFVLRGNTLFKYDAKSLKLEGKTEIEGFTPPRPPEGGSDRGGDRGPGRSPDKR